MNFKKMLVEKTSRQDMYEVINYRGYELTINKLTMHIENVNEIIAMSKSDIPNINVEIDLREIQESISCNFTKEKNKKFYENFLILNFLERIQLEYHYVKSCEKPDMVIHNKHKKTGIELTTDLEQHDGQFNRKYWRYPSSIMCIEGLNTHVNGGKSSDKDKLQTKPIVDGDNKNKILDFNFRTYASKDTNEKVCNLDNIVQKKLREKYVPEEYIAFNENILLVVCHYHADLDKYKDQLLSTWRDLVYSVMEFYKLKIYIWDTHAAIKFDLYKNTHKIVYDEFIDSGQ